MFFVLLASTMGGFTGHHLWTQYWQQYSEVSLMKAAKLGEVGRSGEGEEPEAGAQLGVVGVDLRI